MSLTGLLGTVAEDPQLRQALEYAGLPGAGDADLVAPPALRPVLVAALAARCGRSCQTRTPSRSSPPGKRCRTSGFRRARTPPAGVSPCSAAWSALTAATRGQGP